MLSVILCSLSPLISHIYFCLFSDWRRAFSSNSSTHRFPKFSLRNLCSLVALAVPSLIFAETDTAYCLALISLELVKSKILHAAPVFIRPRTSLISSCTVQLWRLCSSLTGNSLSLYDLWCRPWRVAGFWDSIVFCHAPILRKGLGINNNNNNSRKL